MSQELYWSEVVENRKKSKLTIREVSKTEDCNLEAFVIATSSCDFGVQRNLGRLGARFAPRSVLNSLKSLSHVELDREILVTDSFFLSKNLEEYEQNIKGSSEILSKLPRVDVHLGGGHDHVFCLLEGLYTSGKKNQLVINIDPHCDTRTTETPHSGNPFRRFSEKYPRWSGDLLQLGINPSTNDVETLEGIPRMEIINFENLYQLTDGFSDVSFVSEFDFRSYDGVVISLDADVIDSSLMEGVSSVSYKGLPGLFTRKLILEMARQAKSEKVESYLGIYEYNPLYENLSNKGSRYLAGLIYDYLKVK